MKKIFLLSLLCFLGVQYTFAQTKKIYVSREGGKRSFFTFGKLGYNEFYYTNINSNCDTLILKGNGLERCKIDRNTMKMTGNESYRYAAYNKAIRVAERRTKQNDLSNAGQFEVSYRKHTLLVSYSQADKRGNAVLQIEII